MAQAVSLDVRGGGGPVPVCIPLYPSGKIAAFAMKINARLHAESGWRCRVLPDKAGRILPGNPAVSF